MQRSVHPGVTEAVKKPPPAPRINLSQLALRPCSSRSTAADAQGAQPRHAVESEPATGAVEREALPLELSPANPRPWQTEQGTCKLKI